MRRYLLTGVITLIVLASNHMRVFAQQPISLEMAVTQALQANPAIQASKYEISAAKSNQKSTKALANPDLVVTPSVWGKSGADSAVLFVQPLEINGQRSIRSRIASRELDAAHAVSQAAIRDLVRDVKQAYWSVIQAQQIVELNRSNVEQAQTIDNASKRQRDVGTAPGSQVLKTEVELTRTRQELTIAESELRKAKALLNVLMGRAPETDFVLSDSLTFTPLAAGLNEFYSTNRPELAEAQAVLAIKQQEIRAVSTRRIPDLAIQARLEEFEGEGGVAIGVTLPFIDWGSVRADKNRAHAEAQAQKQRVDATKQIIQLEIQNALTDVRRYEEQVKQYQAGLLSQSERLAEMAYKGYKAGATGYPDVLEAQRTLISVKIDYYTALAGHAKAMAQLEWASGVDLSGDVTQEGKR